MVKQIRKIVGYRATCDVTFEKSDRTRVTKKLLQDNGFPSYFLLDDNLLSDIQWADVPCPGSDPTHGEMRGGYVVVRMSHVLDDPKADGLVVAYSNASLFDLAHTEGCDGLVGIRYLQRVGFGGYRDDCWIRR